MTRDNGKKFLVQLLPASFNVEADPQRIQCSAAELGQAKLDQVFLGRDDKAIRCLLPRPSA
jgi:hypothetical protein